VLSGALAQPGKCCQSRFELLLIFPYIAPDMKLGVKAIGFNRRRFIAALAAGVPLAVVGESTLVEPAWLKVRTLKLAEKPRYRFLHFTDLHYKGNRAFMQKVVRKINAAQPEFVCFTGDLIEENRFLGETLEILNGIKAPLFGVPGNHDYWAKADFGQIQQAFARTGGAWLVNQNADLSGGKVCLHGLAQLNQAITVKPPLGRTNILLLHYPLWVESFFDKKFALILAGHTHGGQVRLPGFGPLLLPFDSGAYDYGLFQTKAGPLYVSSGLGFFSVNVRFNCRPEIVVVEI